MFRPCATLTLLSLAYLFALRIGDYNEGSDLASLTAWRQYLALTWNRGVWPLLIGQWVPEATNSFNEAMVALAQLALIACVVVSIALRRSAWRAWAFFVVLWLAHVVLMGYARLIQFGPGIGHDLRYNAEFAFLIPLTLALAFRPTDEPAARWMPRRVSGTPAIAGAAALLFAISVASSYLALHNRWPAGEARENGPVAAHSSRDRARV